MSPRQDSKSLRRGARRDESRWAPSFVGNIQHSVTHTFGVNLKKKRLESGMTQEEVSRSTGIDRSFISEVESGRQSLSLERAEKLARAVGASLVELLSS